MGMRQGVETGLGYGSITHVLQTQFSNYHVSKKHPLHIPIQYLHDYRGKNSWTLVKYGNHHLINRSGTFLPMNRRSNNATL